MKPNWKNIQNTFTIPHSFKCLREMINQFDKHKNKLKPPFVIYVNTESILKNMDDKHPKRK